MKIIATRYELVDVSHVYTASMYKEGWTLHRRAYGKPNIPPFIQVCTTHGWEAVLSEHKTEKVFNTLEEITIHLGC